MKILYTLLCSMLPLIELRGGIPLGIAQGLDYKTAYIAAVIGSMIPVPFIIFFIKKIFEWMKKNMPIMNNFVEKMEAKAHLKGKKVKKYRSFGLFIFVAIPLPGTGAWTGSLIAAFLDMRLKEALPAILLGDLTAGILMLILTRGVVSII